MIDNAESQGYFNGDNIALSTVWWYKNPPYHWFYSNIDVEQLLNSLNNDNYKKVRKLLRSGFNKHEENLLTKE